MKKLAVIIALSIFGFQAFAQNDSIPVNEEIQEQVQEIQEQAEEIQEQAMEEYEEAMEEYEEQMDVLEEQMDVLEEEMEVFETPEKTQISVGENELFIIEENGDTMKLQLGDKGLSIIEGKDGFDVKVIEMEDEEKEEKKKKKQDKFKPHFGGFEMGLNNYVNPDFSLLNQGFMSLETSRSYNFNLNFMEYGIGFGTSYLGLVTGMGLEWNGYVFDGNNSIEIDGAGEVASRDISAYPSVTKSKFATTYLVAPLLLEVQIPAGKKRIHLSGGVIGGLKTGSKTKIKYIDGGKQKAVDKDDFNLSPFRYGFTARAGYRSINLYATYYMTPLFGEVNTPELYPLQVGLTLIPF